VRDFAYARAGTAEAAVGTLADPGTSVIAGGTELLNWFRLGIAAADRVIDIGGLDELRGIARDGDELRIGALATLNEVGEHPLVTQLAGALASACLQAASAQVRNRATIGGNVLQRTRCPYFRAEEPLPWPCNKRDPGSGCTSLAGRHERQAIFGWTRDCIAVQPSDPAVALAMLDARAEVLGPAGPRVIPMREFHLTQREAAAAGEPVRETRLALGELITGYRVPVIAGGQAYVKVRERASYEYAIVSAAAAVRLAGDPRAADARDQSAAGASEQRIAAARVALGSVAQRPWRLDAAEAELPGTPLTRAALMPVIERAMADADPLPQNGFKVLMARNAAVRALLTAGGAS
jgi:xanthine dehydrogenase YagS FAD-binding subunit